MNLEVLKNFQNGKTENVEKPVIGRVVKTDRNLSLIETLDGRRIFIDRFTSRQILDSYNNICLFDIL